MSSHICIVVLVVIGLNCKVSIAQPGCPPVDPNIRCIRFDQQCKNNTDCKNGEVCCGVTCGTKCIDVGVCNLPKDIGPCKARLRRFYFDSSKKRCFRFFYGGCKGNGNNFKTRSECENACKKSAPPTTNTCEKGVPFPGLNCGFGSNLNSQPCPKGYYCKSDVCCQIPCKFGQPHPTLTCGMVIGSNQCPAGYSCLGGPADEYFACCPNESKVKDGFCPVVKPGTVGICVESCTGDNSCPGTQKCCSNGCGHVCMNPTGGVKPPIESKVKDGFCPVVKPGTVGICVESCTGDNSCPGTQKCCSNGCGHVCMNPTGGVKPPIGKCDFGTPLPNVFCGRGPNRQDCPTDHFCKIDPLDRFAICCPSFKPGKCPVDDSGRMCPAVLRPGECSGDSSCPGIQKCCKAGCIASCQNPKY